MPTPPEETALFATIPAAYTYTLMVFFKYNSTYAMSLGLAEVSQRIILLRLSAKIQAYLVWSVLFRRCRGLWH